MRLQSGLHSALRVDDVGQLRHILEMSQACGNAQTYLLGRMLQSNQKGFLLLKLDLSQCPFVLIEAPVDVA